MQSTYKSASYINTSDKYSKNSTDIPIPTISLFLSNTYIYRDNLTKTRRNIDFSLRARH